IATDKFMPKVSLCQNRVPLKLGHTHSQGRYSMLELDEGKLSRPVLRRGGGSNSVSLAGDTGSDMTRRASRLNSRRGLGTRTREGSIQKVLQMTVARSTGATFPVRASTAL